MQHVEVCHLGRVDYGPAWDLQKRLQAGLIRAKRRQPPEYLPHVLLLLEHPHFYTLGQNGDAGNLLLDPDGLAAAGASYVPVDRGGDITYHGPGQLVGYPIFDLDRFYTDIHRYLRDLENAVIRTCADYGLSAARFPGRTGVWIGPDERGSERKICAMGIRCSRWVTMHGFAFNLNTNLSYFGHIVPCGIPDRGVTSLAQELERPVDEAEAASRLLHHLGAIFGFSASRHAGEEALAVLEEIARDPAASSHPATEPVRA
jgi:lipoyl(octanoyl) transferase